jgi:hypothetical protein
MEVALDLRLYHVVEFHEGVGSHVCYHAAFSGEHFANLFVGYLPEKQSLTNCRAGWSRLVQGYGAVTVQALFTSMMRPLR